MTENAKGPVEGTIHDRGHGVVSTVASDQDLEYTIHVLFRGLEHKCTEDPPQDIIVIIDETSTGWLDQGSEYIVGATSVPKSESEKFSDITKSEGKTEEMKFRTAKIYEKKRVLRKASKLDLRLYAITVKKPSSEPWTEKQTDAVHMKGFEKVLSNVAENEEVHGLHVIKDNLKDRKKSEWEKRIVEDLVSKVIEATGKNITAEVVDSKESFHIQTNDFVMGAMNRVINHDDAQFLKILKVRIERSVLNATFPKKK